ncbi:MAG: helix-turn-helix domain-containing protein [Ignavibacteriales bacterium]|nr:helix-turn-helix domain-containing protein [Ignavibacteriales bacterium]
MNIIAVIILLGIVQGFFVGFFLVTKKSGNRRANNILGAIFFVLSVSMGYYFFYTANLFFKYPHLQKTTFPTTLLFGPLIYFYVKIQTERNYKFIWNHALHFIPFVLVIILNLPFYLKDADYKLVYLSNPAIMKSSMDMLISIFQVIQTSTYIIITKKSINAHVQRLKNETSSLEKMNLHWLNICLNAIISIFVFIASHLVLIYLGVDLSSIYHVTLPIIITIFIFVFGYLGLIQPEIVFPLNDEISVKKYEKSNLTGEKGDEYLKKLLALMTNEKPYIDNILTLQKLADRLQITPHHLSQIINEKLNQNFFDFINTYRVEEAKKMLIDPNVQNLTVLAIAEECGFNSKSSFNTSFKKYTGITPSEFKKQTLQTL